MSINRVQSFGCEAEFENRKPQIAGYGNAAIAEFRDE
jgi:hypothetical protein